MRRTTRSAWAAAALGVATAALASAAAAQQDGYLTNARGLDRRNMDEQAGACVDFYRYANGAWLDRNAIPGDRSRWGVGAELAERNDQLLRRILEEAAAAGAPAGTVRQKVGDLYASALDSARIDRVGAEPIRADLARIDALRTAEDVERLITEYHAQGLGVLFDSGAEADLQNSSMNILYVTQGGLGLPEKDYYLREGEEAQRIRDQYVEHVARMLALAGQAPEAAQRQARTVLEMETRLAKASLGVVELRNPANFYKIVTPAQAEEATPHFRWSRYLPGIGVQAESFSFPHTAFFAAADSLLAEAPVEDWKAYLRWHLVSSAAPYLSSEFEKEDFRFFSTVLEGTPEMQPRWKRARGVVNGLLGEALGQLYVAEAFPPESKARGEEMIRNIQAALRERLQGLEWMGDSTRALALQKLATFTPKIGYPDEWRDYSALAIDRDAFFQNVRRGTAFERRYNLAKVGKPVDPAEWGMTPQTVNAYYNPLRNEIVFPAAIMQPPLFDGQIDDPVNYGAMGAIIGHEIMHGFDDQGSQFDAQGNFRNWWTEQDRTEFERRAKVLVDQYSGYVAIDSLTVNGQLTLGENIGDLGGLTIAFDGLKRAMRERPGQPVDGFTPEQRFFLSWAQAWRSLQRDEALKVQVQTDPHSPARFRAIGPVANMPQFAEAFGCKPGDPMVRGEDERVKIW